MTNFKIIVLCGGKFAFPSLQALGFEKNLAGVAIGKGESGLVSLLKTEVENSGFPFIEIPTKKNCEELFDWINEIKPDAVFSICFPFLLSQKILDLVPGKFINFHTGPLPEYRGAMPIFEVLKARENSTAISVHIMDAGFDQGPLILSEQVIIAKDDTFGTLTQKLSNRTAIVAINIAQMLQYGTTVPTILQDKSSGSYYPIPSFENTLIRWKNMNVEQIEALIRACNPWNLGADTQLNGKIMKIVSASKSEIFHSHQPGTIIEIDEQGKMHIACIDGERLLVDIMNDDSGIFTARQFMIANSAVGWRFNS